MTGRSEPGPDRLPGVVIVSASIGAGHDGAARELARRLTVGGFAVRRLDFLDMVPAGWRAVLRDGYAHQLRYAPATWGWLLGAASGPRSCASASALSGRVAANRMRAAIGPDPIAVVSTYPLAGQVLGRLRRSGLLAAPAIAVMTDPSVHPLCAAAGVDLHVGSGDAAVTALRALGCGRAERVGPVVDPAFQPSRGLADAYDARRRLGLPPIDRLAVVVAGSWGVGDVAATVRDLAAIRSVTPVVVCGHNERLRRQLSGHAIALGWVDDMPSLLRTADVVVHNAGGLSSLEAMASGVPVISYRCLPGHGTANAAVLAAAGLSPWPRSREELAAVLRRAFTGDLLREQRAAYRDVSAAPDAATLIAALAAPPTLIAPTVAGVVAGGVDRPVREGDGSRL